MSHSMLLRSALFVLLSLSAHTARSDAPDGTTGTWSSEPAVVGRVYYGAIPLSDDRILIAGGEETDWAPTRSVEIFDPTTRQFMPVASLHTSFFKPTLLDLGDGRVLAAGWPIRGTREEWPDEYWPEIYDSERDVWTIMDEVRLTSDDVIYVNRLEGGNVLLFAMDVMALSRSSRRDMKMYRAWLYEPVSGSIEELEPPFTPRSAVFPLIHPSGYVLLTGGNLGFHQPEHLCEQIPAEYAIAAGVPSGDWCAAHGQWRTSAAQTTEVWNIASGELHAYEDAPPDRGGGLFTQALENGDVLALDRDRILGRTTGSPIAASVWSMQSKTWDRIDDFPPHFHTMINNDLVELDDAVLVGPSGAFSLHTGQWDPLPDDVRGARVIELPSGQLGRLRPRYAPYWFEFDAVTAEWIDTAEAD